MLPPPSVIERRMDDQSVLAHRARNAGGIENHDDAAIAQDRQAEFGEQRMR